MKNANKKVRVLKKTCVYPQCYKYDNSTNSWTFLTNMTTGRDFSASVSINGKLFVMGGLGGKNELSSTEIISLDENVSQPGPELPFPRSKHCLVKLSTGKVMIIGGDRDETEQSVIIFDPDGKTFDHSLPSLNEERIGLGKDLFRYGRRTEQNCGL